MLKAAPKGFFSSDYRIVDAARQTVAEIAFARWRRQGFAKVGDAVYKVSREGFGGPYVFKAPDQSQAARVVKPRAFRDTFEISFGGRLYQLKAISLWRRRYGLFLDDRLLGSIVPRYFQRWEIDLPDEVPVLLQVFAARMAIFLWRNS